MSFQVMLEIFQRWKSSRFARDLYAKEVQCVTPWFRQGDTLVQYAARQTFSEEKTVSVTLA